MKRSARATVIRSARRALTWQPKRRGRRAIDIEELISPLRYDVLVRARFFRFLSARPEGESAEAVVAAAWDEPYAVWFRDVAMARFRPWVLKDEAVLQECFTERVLASRNLLASFNSKGFDFSCPVTLRLTRGPQTTDTGAVLTRSVHVGDGGHRLALLLHSGSQLLPGMYRLDPRPVALIDNTAVLLGRLGISEAEYLEFLGKGYAASADDVTGLLRAVDAADPVRGAELASVVAAHQRVWSGVP